MLFSNSRTLVRLFYLRPILGTADLFSFVLEASVKTTDSISSKMKRLVFIVPLNLLNSSSKNQVCKACCEGTLFV